MIKKIIVIFGTRPEAIKLSPVIKRLKAAEGLKAVVCVTAQHREMLDEVINLFQIVPDYDLNIMIPNQDLFNLTTKLLISLKDVLIKEKPDLVVIQGDTTTSFVATLVAYYLQIPIAHVEAGLRTYNKYSPFPEEINRNIISVMADLHFAPTEQAKSNLLKEGIPENKIHVTGNTVIDALLAISSQCGSERKELLEKRLKAKCGLTLDTCSDNTKLILVTSHRREHFGRHLQGICSALKEIAQKRPDIRIVYPVHLNPNVQNLVTNILNNIPNIFLVDPLDYESFVYVMNKSYLVLTDSGGIQEEAPSLGKPVLVIRNTTERWEGIDAGTAKLIGICKEIIVSEVHKLLDDTNIYKKMANAVNPYGDGKASERIISLINQFFDLTEN